MEVVGQQRDSEEYVVISGFGPRADWLRNIEAGGPIPITVGGSLFIADHRLPVRHRCCGHHQSTSCADSPNWPATNRVGAIRTGFRAVPVLVGRKLSKRPGSRTPGDNRARLVAFAHSQPYR